MEYLDTPYKYLTKYKSSRHNQLVSWSLNVRKIMDFFRNYFGKLAL